MVLKKLIILILMGCGLHNPENKDQREVLLDQLKGQWVGEVVEHKYLDSVNIYITSHDYRITSKKIYYSSKTEVNPGDLPGVEVVLEKGPISEIAVDSNGVICLVRCYYYEFIHSEKFVLSGYYRKPIKFEKIKNLN